MKKALQILKRIVSDVITLLLVLILILVTAQKITGEVPGAFGYRLMYVLTGSMEPQLSAGDAILVKTCDGAAVSEGDIVCYQSTQGDTDGMIITHQVVVAPHEEDGEIILQTKGTANELPDNPIEAGQVMGRVVVKLTVLGKIYQFFCTVPGLIVVCAPILLLIVAEIRKMVLLVREDVAEELSEISQQKGEDENERTEHEENAGSEAEK